MSAFSAVITKEDLKEPYDRLSDFLSISEIITIEQAFRGRQIRFRRDCADVVVEYPELTWILGIEKALQMIRTLGGMWVYFPELRTSCREKIKHLIITECNGYNYTELAKKYGYTVRHVRSIVSGSVKRRPSVDANQMTLFELLENL